MILPDKRIKQETFGNITDYSQRDNCPKGWRSFFAYAQFTDGSNCLCDYIFAPNRTVAFGLAVGKFADCAAYLQGITVYAEDGEN